MSRIDFVKKAIIERTVVRDEVLDNSAIQKYYDDLVEAMQIKNFPLVSVNTIEKKTYMMQESDGQCYLVFDHYLLDCIYLLNQFVLQEKKTKPLGAFFYKTMSEECYTQHKITAAIGFAGKYMQHINNVIEQYKKREFVDEVSEYLFVQQAFLIAHELFHFYIHRNPENHKEGLNSKARYLKNIYEYVFVRNADTAAMMDRAIKSDKMVEECLCDSTAVIQAIDVGRKVGKLNVVESGVSTALALMNQYAISIIQDAVKYSGDISYERMQNLFNFRVLHIKAFAEQYIKKYYSDGEAQSYRNEVEIIHDMWLEKVFTPIMHLLVEGNTNILLKEYHANDYKKSEENRRAINILKEIYNS